jgi:hypothetical protein
VKDRSQDAVEAGQRWRHRSEAGIDEVRSFRPKPSSPGRSVRTSGGSGGLERARGLPLWSKVAAAVGVGIFAIGLLAEDPPDEDQADQADLAVATPTTERQRERETVSTAPSAPATTAPPAPTTTVDPVSLMTDEELAALDAFLNPPPPTTPAPAPPPPPPAPTCDPHYTDGCVPIDSDVDCAGGSGDGPSYAGFARVVGSDPYDLDSDNDGLACEG